VFIIQANLIDFKNLQKSEVKMAEFDRNEERNKDEKVEKFGELLAKIDVDQKVIESLPENYFETLSNFFELVLDAARDDSLTGKKGETSSLSALVQFLLDHQELMDDNSITFLSAMESSFVNVDDEELRIFGEFVSLVRKFIEMVKEDLQKLMRRTSPKTSDIPPA